MGFFDSLGTSLERQAKQNERKARISYGNQLRSAYDSTDDSGKKSELQRKWRENGEALHNL